MAKTAWINRNERKRATVKQYAALRAELKAKEDYAGLAQLPRDASPTRVVNRCEVTGRRRAFIRRFKMSRLTFRELASQGLVSCVTQASWEISRCRRVPVQAVNRPVTNRLLHESLNERPLIIPPGLHC